MNPATCLRALGPEPWRVAYVEPSRRPTDGRYGENPNRLQHYYQYQVIIKPAPLEHHRPLPPEPRRPRHRTRGPRYPLRGGRLGITYSGGLGPGVGGLARRNGSHPVHLLPAGRRHRHGPCPRRDNLRNRAHSHVRPESGRTSTTLQCGWTT